MAKSRAGAQVGAAGASLKKYNAALDRAATALHAHADSLNAAAKVTTALTRQQIIKVLAERWGVPANDVDEKEPITDYITGGPGAITAYYQVLNSLFSGLHLRPRDMAGIIKVGDMVDVILRGLS